MSHLIINTSLGTIRLALCSDAAPETVAHVRALAAAKLIDNSGTFYRSDFVIQCGLHNTGKSFPPLSINEAKRPCALSNRRGCMAVAHWDV